MNRCFHTMLFSRPKRELDPSSWQFWQLSFNYTSHSVLGFNVLDAVQSSDFVHNCKLENCYEDQSGELDALNTILGFRL